MRSSCWLIVANGVSGFLLLSAEIVMDAQNAVKGRLADQ
jgi:hypothetical protein